MSYSIDHVLEWPFNEEIVRAELDFNKNESNQLDMKKGCDIVLMTKYANDINGWLRGRYENKVF